MVSFGQIRKIYGNKIIELYGSRKIAQLQTAENIIIDFLKSSTDKQTKSINSKYDKLLSKHTELEPLTHRLRLKTSLRNETVVIDDPNSPKTEVTVKVNPNNMINDNHKDFDNSIGKYNSDINIRFKNKSNNGRALVFFQLGIPVIADYTPSNMHILGDEQNGYAVLSSYGWYNALEKLLCEKKRQEIANNAYNEYQKKYNHLKWSKKLYKEIKNIVP